MFEYERYRRDCQQQNRPFIRAKTNPLHGNYYVELDMMTCDSILSCKVQGLIHELIQSEILHVRDNLKYSFAGFNIGRDHAWFDGIPLEHVETFCNSLYDLCTVH